MKIKKLICSFSATMLCMTSLVNIVPYNLKTYAADEKIEKAIGWAISIAKDDSHGYSQANRQGPDYDCSSLVVNALKHAGISTGSASYTGNMKSELIKYGFYWIPWSEINSVSNLQRGDILLHRTSSSGHTEIYLGNNMNVGAHSSYGHPEAGDQTGKEISVADYWYDNWNGVLRYGDNPPPPPPPPGYFPACGSGYTSIVEALNSVGAESSYDYRAKIAVANGISGYGGTASQNTQMLDLLKSGALKMPTGEEIIPPTNDDPPGYKETYFPACTAGYISIVEALKSIGVDSSYDNRKIIAAKNGVSNYGGTAEQNLLMLSLLEQGKLINPNGATAPVPDTSGKYYEPCASGYASLVDALNSIGVDSSYSYRKQIAVKNGISDYSGTAAQNTKLIGLLESGKLIRVDYVEVPAVTNLTVSLDPCGGSSPIASMTVTSVSKYNGLPTATKEGYTFAGWYTASSGGTKVEDGGTLVSISDHTLYAHWNANKYTVSFENNDGSGITSDKEVVYNSSYGELPIPKRTGYTFVGWFTEATDDGTQIKSNSKFTLADNQTLYAHWTTNKYNVNLYVDEKIFDTVTVYYNNFYGELPVPDSTSAVFNGWYTSDGLKISEETLVAISENHNLYAKWKNNLAIEKNNVTLKNGEQYVIKANQKNLIYKSNNTDVAIVSKNGTITALSEGTAIISVINEDSDVVQLKLTVESAVITGDCNSDGKFNIADAVLLQKWLLSIPVDVTDISVADLYNDGKIDVFDLIMMRIKLTT